MHKRWFLGSALGVVALFAPSAWASGPDEGRPFSWTGFYVGGQVGVLSMDDAFSDPVAGISGSVHGTGAIAGVHLGYNFQSGRIVYGIEADVSWSNAVDSGTGFFLGAPTVTGDAELNWQASLRARLGFTHGSTLFYGTGGVVWGNFDLGYTFPLAPPNVRDGFTDTLTGWTVGAGIETALGRNWTGRVEYRFTDYGSTTGSIANCCAGPPFHQRHELESQSITVGLSYKF